MSNENKNATLGMPHGTACGRLRKNILFRLLCRLEENVCFKCDRIIEKVEDLSIEHKEPWEGISAELFWDLENIAFSHIGCNRPHSYGAIKRRKIGPEGTAWCQNCKQFLLRINFHPKTNHWNGLQSICKVCKDSLDVRRNHAKKGE